MTFSPKTSFDDLFDRARERYHAWPLNETQFRIETGWAQSYDDVFSGTFSHVLEEDEILSTVLSRGRAILSGRGGSGKTWLLRRLYLEILERGDLAILLDLKQWSGGDYDSWSEWTSNEVGNAADWLVRKFGGVSLGAIELDRLPPSMRKVLLVDGLNEITSQVGSQILQLLDELVQEQMNLSVFVVDRLVRRDLPSPARWWIGTPLPLSEDQVRQHLGKRQAVKLNDILTSPFFLDAALRYHVQGHRRSQASERFLTVHGGISESDLDQVGAAAFNAYQRSQSRMFDRTLFARLAGEAATATLEASGTIVTTADRSYFVHHILHDYLAARHFARQPVKKWTPDKLSVLSFDASSFDAIELVFEQLDEGRADVFLRQLYDWNLYGAGYALAQARDTDACVSNEMRTMIFAMLAEKRFDPILSTRQNANDALAFMQLSDAKRFRDAKSLSAVIGALNSTTSNVEWFNRWKALFQIEPDARLLFETLSSIRDADSIIGWTVANVAKRSMIDETAIEWLAAWSASERNATVRWRIAHVLGAYPTSTAFETLRRLLDHDPDGSVRYGAIRSIVELAAGADSGLQATVRYAIEERAGAINSASKIAGELRKCLLMDTSKVTSTWLPFVAGVVKAMFVAADNTTERDLWRRCLNDAERLYTRYEGTSRTKTSLAGGRDG